MKSPPRFQEVEITEAVKELSSGPVVELVLEDKLVSPEMVSSEVRLADGRASRQGFEGGASTNKFDVLNLVEEDLELAQSLALDDADCRLLTSMKGTREHNHSINELIFEYFPLTTPKIKVLI